MLFFFACLVLSKMCLFYFYSRNLFNLHCIVLVVYVDSCSHKFKCLCLQDFCNVLLLVHYFSDFIGKSPLTFL